MPKSKNKTRVNIGDLIILEDFIRSPKHKDDIGIVIGLWTASFGATFASVVWPCGKTQEYFADYLIKVS